MGKKVKVDLEANQSLSVEIEDNPTGEMFAKLWLWYERSGKFTEMSASAFKVLGYLLMCADFNDLQCYPSLKTIVGRTGLAKQTVVTAISQLVDMQLIMKMNRSDKRGDISNYYTIVRPPAARVQKLDTGCPPTRQGVSNEQTDPCPMVRHKQETHNENQLTRKERFSFDDECVDPAPVSMTRNIVAVLATSGVSKFSRFQLASKMIAAGLDDGDAERAGKNAAFAVLSKKTANSQEIDMTGGLTPLMLEKIGGYTVGVIERAIEQGLSRIELNPGVEAVVR